MDDMDQVLIWLYSESGNGKTTLARLMGLDNIFATDLMFINNIDLVKSEAPDVASLWNHKYDVCHEGRILGNLGIAGFWLRLEEKDLYDKFIDLTFPEFTDQINWMEGWVPDRVRASIHRRVKERGMRLWELNRV